MKFENEIELARFTQELGGTLYLVGGAVRDQYLGLAAKDRDYMATGLNLESLPFEKVVGHDFPVFLVEVAGETCELALARKEKKVGQGYHGFTIHTDSSVTVEDDLSRRDLTINAMAVEVLTGRLVDPYNGQNDLKRKTLRHTSPAFAEDPLRVYRVARFAAKFGFQVAPETLTLMEELRNELRSLKAERIWLEVEKALASKNAGTFFEILSQSGVLDVHFPELEALKVPDMHDGTALNHTLRVMNHGENAIERFALLVHDFGKGVTPADQHHHNHDQLGVDLVKGFCKRLRVPNAFVEVGVLSASEHMKLKNLAKMKKGKCFRYVLSQKKHIRQLAKISFLDSAHREGADYTQELTEYQKWQQLIGLAFITEKEVVGKALLERGIKPGPEFGQKLFDLRVAHFVALVA